MYMCVARVCACVCECVYMCVCVACVCECVYMCVCVTRVQGTGSELASFYEFDRQPFMN